MEVAVEAEVARRLAVRERETAECVKAEEKRPSECAQVTDSRMTQSRSKLPEKAHSIPSGVLTPLLKCHRALLTREELLCSLADANSAATLAQWYKW